MLARLASIAELSLVAGVALTSCGPSATTSAAAPPPPPVAQPAPTGPPADASPSPDSGPVVVVAPAPEALTFGDVGASEGYAVADVERTLEAAFADYRRCQVQALARVPDLEGEIRFQLMIDSNGNVFGLSATMQVVDEGVFLCARRVTSRLTFPKPRGERAELDFTLELNRIERAQDPRPGDARVEVVDISVEPGRSAGEVKAVLRKHRGAFADCYDRALAQAPKLAGELEVGLEVDPRGNVSSAGVLDSQFPPELEGCVIEGFGKLRFPPAPATTAGRVRLRFRPL